jgi:hypothetical protein
MAESPGEATPALKVEGLEEFESIMDRLNAQIDKANRNLERMVETFKTLPARSDI